MRPVSVTRAWGQQRGFEMQTAQWAIAAITAGFVAAVAFLQWRRAQQTAVLDLFERRYAIYEVVRNAVGIMTSNSNEFDQRCADELTQAMDRAYFFFGDDVARYLEQLWSAIMGVCEADKELPHIADLATRKAAEDKRRAGLTSITQFYRTGRPLFAKYMRFSQRVQFLDRT
jgi:hypothetical protein